VTDALRSEAVTRREAAVLLVLLVLMWGTSFPLIKSAFAYMPPLWFAATRMGTGAAFIFLLLWWRGRLRVPSRADAPVLVSVGIGMMTCFPALTHSGLFFVDSGRATLLAYLTPLWVTPAAIVLLGERLTALKAAGLVLAVGGLLVLFHPGEFDWSDRDVVIGNGILLFGSMVWACTILHVRAHRWSLGPLELVPWQLLIATVLLSALAAVIEGGTGHGWDLSFLALVLYCGPVASVYTVFGSTTVNRALPAITTALAYIATPVIGYAAGMAMLGERLTLLALLGLGLIVLGLSAVAWSESRERGG